MNKMDIVFGVVLSISSLTTFAATSNSEGKHHPEAESKVFKDIQKENAPMFDSAGRPISAENRQTDPNKHRPLNDHQHKDTGRAPVTST